MSFTAAVGARHDHVVEGVVGAPFACGSIAAAPKQGGGCPREVAGGGHGPRVVVERRFARHQAERREQDGGHARRTRR